MRTSELSRKTGETEVFVKLNIDGSGRSKIDTGCPFLDHMLTLFSKHSGMDIEISAKGDVEVDYHHTTEDVAILFGAAFSSALEAEGALVGINRYGDTILPMDEALILTAVDVSGRAHLEYFAEFRATKVGGFDVELCEEFWRAFVRKAAITLHIRQLAGTNSHHIIEGIFKSTARSLGEALSKNGRYEGVPSTKGVI